MSAERNAGARKAIRQFALALVACLAVAGGAAVAAGGEGDTPATQHVVAEDNWPIQSPAPGN
ncbi:hypothetical protein ABZ135_15260 [Streptomyces sp. NPDC006339]|uniref:hypothetical protein n=1 Tax=Streptomyces sp. NPDC006339 TaxID=3156755 RepID=UPI0033B12000